MKRAMATETSKILTKKLLKLQKLGDLDGVKLFLESLRNRAESKDLLHHRYNAGDTIMHYCVRFGHLNLLQYLNEEWDVNLNVVNNDHKTLLHEAASFKMHEIVFYLLKKNMEIDALKHGDWTPLMMACSKKHNTEIVKKLIEHGADYHLRNKDGWTCFHIACRTDKEMVICLLTVDGLLWDTASKNFRTPLHTACINGNLDVVEAIIPYCQKKLNAKDSCGNTPFMDAVRSGNEEIIKLLIESGCDTNTRDTLGRNALHICAEMGILSSITLLVNTYQVDVNILTVLSNNRKGQTPMHWAYKEKQFSAAYLLKELGADENILDWKGRSPMDMLT